MRQQHYTVVEEASIKYTNNIINTHDDYDEEDGAYISSI
jgi:hypothetical protein